MIFWNFLLPLPVNCMSTTGPRLGSRSARVPESLRSAPVSSGIGFALFSGSYLKRYHVVPVGAPFTPGQTTASVPHEIATVPFGTPKTTYLGFDPASDFSVIPSRFARLLSSMPARVAAGPAMTFFVALSKRYHPLAPFCLTSACWPERSE